MSYEKELSEKLLNTSIDCIVAFDKNCCYTIWNPAAESLTGISKEEVLGKCAFDVFPTLRERGLDKHFYETLQGKNVISKDSRHILPKTGQEIFLDTYYSPLYDEMGEVIGGLIIARDMTEHKLAEARLQKALSERDSEASQYTTESTKTHEQLEREVAERQQIEAENHFLQTMKQAVFESSDFQTALRVALQKVCEATSWVYGEAWIPHPDGSFLECSEAWYTRADSLASFRSASLGMTFAPSVGLPGRVWALKQPEWRRDVSVESNQIYLRAQQAMECGLRAALGIPLIANEHVIAVLVFYMLESRDEDKRLIELISASTELGLFIQRKQTEGEMHKALLRERELNELKSRFISMTSHEFRTPLTTILFSADLLEKYSQQWTDEKKLKYIHGIQVSVKNMNQLLDDVLLIGKIESGKQELKTVLLNLEKFCSDLVEEFQLSAGSNHTISFIQQGQDTDAYIDEKLCRQILSNLLSNAIKYSPRNSTIYFTAYYQTGEAIFQIKDQGIGIPETDQKRLFDSFHRASNVGNIPGTGLGLAIVKKSVELHGGQITVDSEVGVGTTFTVTLPLEMPTTGEVNPKPKIG